MTLAVRLRSVSKTFVIRRNASNSLKVRTLALLHRRHRESVEPFHALRDIDLEVARGEFLGLVGPNGSGKSTLLRLIAGIYPPTSGRIEVAGRVAPMIELGVGFHPELSGRDNVYLNTSLYGLSRRETDAFFERVLEFSGIGDFIDAPVKSYSTGMYARLGFAVAVHLDADILLVDEVLAVGDASFQETCLAHIAGLRRRGATVILVSHDLSLVERMCDRAALLTGGAIVAHGRPDSVVPAYRQAVAGASSEA